MQRRMVVRFPIKIEELSDMNALLEKALAEVARLPEAEQEAIASLILDEIAAERDWDERFARTQDQLGDLVRSARGRSSAGRGAVRRSV